MTHLLWQIYGSRDAKHLKTTNHFFRIVENCRYYNPPGTPVSKTAEALEAFVVQKLVALREKLLARK